MHEGMSIHDKLSCVTLTQDVCDDSSEIAFRYRGSTTVPMALRRAERNADTFYCPIMFSVPDRKLYTATLAAMAEIDWVGHSVDMVILNDPATVAYVDGKRVVAKAKDGDEYDPLVGLMVCATRVAGKNRVSIDAWEHIIQYLADNLGSAKECRMPADVLNLTADMWDAEGVAEKMDEWAESKSGETGFATGFVTKSGTFADKVADAMAEALSAAVESDQERTRRILRDLIDGGEL